MNLVPVSGYYHFPPLWVGIDPGDGVDMAIEERQQTILSSDMDNGMRVKVFRDGMFLFDFSNWPADGPTPIDYATSQAAILRRLLVLNAHVACLHSAMLEQGEVWAKHVVDTFTKIDAGSLDAMQFTYGDSRVAALAGGGNRTFSQGAGSRAVPFLKVEADLRSMKLSEAAVRRSIDLLLEVLSKDFPGVAELTEFYLKACKAAEEFDFSLSHTVSWSVCEKLLNILWGRYLDARKSDPGITPGSKRINRDRRKKLTGADLTASIKSEILELADELLLPMHERLAKARSVRNKWQHELRPVSIEDAESALVLVSDMLQEVYALPIRLKPQVDLFIPAELPTAVRPSRDYERVVMPTSKRVHLRDPGNDDPICGKWGAGTGPVTLAPPGDVRPICKHCVREEQKRRQM